jgi:hypothetical protein
MIFCLFCFIFIKVGGTKLKHYDVCFVYNFFLPPGWYSAECIVAIILSVFLSSSSQYFCYGLNVLCPQGVRYWKVDPHGGDINKWLDF